MQGPLGIGDVHKKSFCSIIFSLGFEFLKEQLRPLHADSQIDRGRDLVYGGVRAKKK